jgi:hypothetical protein
MQEFWGIAPKPPTLMKETTFFTLHGIKLRWVQISLRGKVDVYQPSCPSFLCDRKEPIKINHACGCFSHPGEGNFSPVVLEGAIISDDKDNGGNEIFNVKNDRSCRTACMFVTRPDSMGMLQLLDRLSTTTGLRKSIEKCHKHVNKNGGFTVCGTIARGEIQDASDEQVKIASEKTACRICYSQPTKLGVLRDANCLKLKFTCSMPSASMPALSTAGT